MIDATNRALNRDHAGRCLPPCLHNKGSERSVYLLDTIASGTRSTWDESWKSSEIIAMKFAFTSQSAAALQENDLANRRPPVLDHYACPHQCRGLFQTPTEAQFTKSPWTGSSLATAIFWWLRPKADSLETPQMRSGEGDVSCIQPVVCARI
jgi:hypothetical protein